METSPCEDQRASVGPSGENLPTRPSQRQLPTVSPRYLALRQALQKRTWLAPPVQQRRAAMGHCKIPRPSYKFTRSH